MDSETTLETPSEVDCCSLWLCHQSDHAEMVRRGWRDISWEAYRKQTLNFVHGCPESVILVNMTLSTFDHIAGLVGIDTASAEERLELIAELAMRMVQHASDAGILSKFEIMPDIYEVGIGEPVSQFLPDGQHRHSTRE